MRDQPVGQVAARDRLARTRDQQARRRVEVDAVRRRELDLAVERARWCPVGTRERARERRQRAVAGTVGGLGRRQRARPQLPGRALEQQPPPQRDRRLTGRRRQQPVQVVAREVRPPRQRRAVGRLVERRDDDVDQLAQAVLHAHNSLIVFDVLLDARAPSPPPLRRMASWSEFTAAAPELAERVRERFDAHKHKTMATIRRDGSPRISGTETQIKDGELWIGSMWKAVKALDLQRDPRFAIHSATEDPDKDWRGRGEDRRAWRRRSPTPTRSARATARRARAGRRTCSGSTCARSRRSSSTRPRRDKLLIEVWTPERGVRVIER